MADKEEEASSPSSETGGSKACETPEIATTEDVPQTLEPQPSEAQNVNNDVAPAPKDKKIEVLLKATGDAPIMKKKKWVVNPEQSIGWISEFIKKMINLGAEDRLFLYINQTFSPAPDQTVKNLYDCYGTDGKLIIHYCKSQAWG